MVYSCLVTINGKSISKYLLGRRACFLNIQKYPSQSQGLKYDSDILSSVEMPL